MPFELPVGGAAERALLAEAALSDAALEPDPNSDAVHAYADVVTPNPLAAAPVLDEAAMRDELRDLLGEDPRAWGRNVPLLVEYMLEHVTDAPSFVVFLRASHDALRGDALAECEMDPDAAMAGAQEMARVFGPAAVALGLQIVGVAPPGAAFHALLAANPGLATNSVALVLGILEGIGASGVASAESLRNFLIATTATSVLAPLHALGFVAGTVYQVAMDVYGVFDAVVKAIGFADELLPFACRVLAALPAALARLVDAEAEADVAQLGVYVGQMLGTTVKDAFVPAFDGDSGFVEIGTALATFSFNCGTWFGPFVLDLVLMFLGVGYLEVAVKALGKVVQVGADALEWVLDVLRRLLDAVDPGLVDELLAFGARVANAVWTRVAALADEAEAAYGIAKEAVLEGFETIERALGRERFQRYTSSVFCTLEVE